MDTLIQLNLIYNKVIIINLYCVSSWLMNHLIFDNKESIIDSVLPIS